MRGMLEYAPGDTLLHRLNPLTKLLTALLICVSCFVSASLLFLLGVLGLNLALAALGGIFRRAASMLKTLCKLSVVLFLLQIFFIRDGAVLLSLPLGLVVTDRGLRFSVLLVLRLICATMPLALMLSLTKVTDLLNVLVGTLGIPYKYAFALTTAIRFIPVFAREMAGIMEAQTARGVEFDTKNPLKKLKLLLPLCVPLLISSVRKIEGSAISAELRGFCLRTRKSGYKRYPFVRRDCAVLALCLCLVAVAAVV